MVQRRDGEKRGREDGGQGAGKADEQRGTTTMTPDTPYGERSERRTAFGGVLGILMVRFNGAVHWVSPAGALRRCAQRRDGLRRAVPGGGAGGAPSPAICDLAGDHAVGRAGETGGERAGHGVGTVRVGAATGDVNSDTTVATVYGAIEGARKGHHTKHRGKQGLRPVLGFLEEPREYLCGTPRRGETIRNEEVARQIRQFRKQGPACVWEGPGRGDGEFIGWDSVDACLDEGCFFTVGNKRCDPPFPEDGWHRHGDDEYHECLYQPVGWERPCRFVVMRIRADQRGARQLKLLEAENDLYRVFVTNANSRPHRVIDDDQRTDAEHLIGDAQREGVLAMPSKRVQAHHAFPQIVMPAYTLWRWMKRLAGHAARQKQQGMEVPESKPITRPDHTIRIARLTMLFVAAKMRFHSHRDDVRDSVHAQRAAGVIAFLADLDRRRKEARAAA